MVTDRFRPALPPEERDVRGLAAAPKGVVEADQVWSASPEAVGMKQTRGFFRPVAGTMKSSSRGLPDSIENPPPPNATICLRVPMEKIVSPSPPAPIWPPGQTRTQSLSDWRM